MNDPITLPGAPFEIKAGMIPGEKVPRFKVAPAYTGGVLKTERYPEGIIIDLTGLTRNPQTITATLDHDDGRLVGHVVDVHIDARQVSLAGVVSAAGAAADEFLESNKRGFPWRASVEARPLERPEYIPAGEAVVVNGQSFRGPVLVARRAELFGISFVPRGADENTSVSIAAKEKTQMTTQTQTELQAAVDATIQAADISPEASTLLRAQALAGEITFNEFERSVIQCAKAKADLDALRASRPMGPQIISGPRTAGKHAVQAALFKHMGLEAVGEKALGPEAMEAGAALRCTSMMDVIKASLTAAGRDIPASRDDMIRAAFSTADLAGMLGNTANKLLLDSYQAVPSVARMIARPLSANNFKSHTGYRLTGDNAFKLLPPSGEIKHGTLGEQSYSYKVDTYARMFGVTRNDIINDDLGALQAVPMALGRGAAVALEAAFWTLVLANTGTFFGTGNGNYISGVGSALDITALGSAVTKMRQQTDEDGVPVLVVPKYLVVPPELESTADALYTSTNIVATGTTDLQTPAGNPHANKYMPLVVPHLSNSTYSGYSTTAWYLFGDPSDVAAFGVAYLNGVESPTVESQDAPFDTLGMQFRGYLDFGVCQIDHRGGVQSAGA